MLIPLILSGGAGTRLWPVSRAGHPKPFLQLADGESLLQKTLLRAARLPGCERLLVATNRDLLFHSVDEATPLLADGSLPPTDFLLEPMGRNTLPAIALGALAVRTHWGANSLLLVLPADHLVSDQTAFANDVAIAAATAREGYLVTFGVRPTRPETGFGYIETGRPLATGAIEVECFKEKPDYATASAYLADGRHLWNAGMFCFSAATLLAELEYHQPESLAAIEACWNARREHPGHPNSWVFDDALFAALPDLSIDYGVMEHTARAAVVPARFEWSDIGSWNALAALIPPDDDGNRREGDALFVSSRDCYVRAEDRLVAAVGVRDLFIVETPDAVLVTDRTHAQHVKDVVGELHSRQHEAASLHRTVVRPWGVYAVLEEGPSFKIKRIEVKPGGRLSLQLHRQRSEHWVVVSGRARVTRGDACFDIGPNESTYIPAGERHRLENPGSEALVLIEVQCGAYLGEDDIVRFDDVYGREAAASSA